MARLLPVYGRGWNGSHKNKFFEIVIANQGFWDLHRDASGGRSFCFPRPLEIKIEDNRSNIDLPIWRFTRVVLVFKVAFQFEMPGNRKNRAQIIGRPAELVEVAVVESFHPGIRCETEAPYLERSLNCKSVSISPRECALNYP